MILWIRNTALKGKIMRIIPPRRKTEKDHTTYCVSMNEYMTLGTLWRLSGMATPFAWKGKLWC